MTALFTHEVFGAHETPPGHVEQQGRYWAVDRILGSEDFSDFTHEVPPLADWSDIKRAHAAMYVEAIRETAPAEGMVQLDPDTFMGPHSLEAARRGAGGAIAAVDLVMKGKAMNAFVAARPPGHHTVPDRAMGFCLFNNAAIAALHARVAHGAQRIAVVDFDVHHGNGTQDILEADENAFFASSHEWPQYPGTGREQERGTAGNCHNAPLSSGEGGHAFRKVWGDRLLPALSDFSPDFIVISAGFDAHGADPVGGLELTEDDFAWVSDQICQVAADSCHGRLVSVLEGGYDLDALARSTATHVKALARASGTR
ncbi:MAG: histone deacetylase family protein [Pseudomonadota bacterium]